MKPKISSITLGVDDLEKAAHFYGYDEGYTDHPNTFALGSRECHQAWSFLF
jgi:catechol 2,3-dioxygenase-like lactoylglutathione lyase family enzyme